MIEIPKTWVNSKLGDICFTTSGGTPSRKRDDYYGGTIPWVKSGELSKGVITKTEEYITDAAVKGSSAKVFPAGTLLIALYGATIGKLGFLGVDAATNQAICGIFKNEILDLNYLFYFLYHNKNKLIEQGAGGAQPNISQTILKELEITIPPPVEQLRIVAKIEELFSDLDKGIENLKTAQEQLKIYRQAVLKYACEGRLTNPELNEGQLPIGWQLKKLGEIFKSTSGGTPSRKRDDFYGGNIPWVKSGELSKGLINQTDEYITEEALRNSSAKIFPAGTLLIALYGATIGKLGFLGIAAATNQAVCGIFPSEDVSLNYMFHFLTLNKQKLIESAVGGAQPNISQTILKDLEVCYPVENKIQELVVAEIESRLSVCDKIEESIEQGLKQAEALRQSILKKAFEGKLVPQDPNDEPAHVLIQRIKSERAAAQPVKKQKKTKA